MKYTKYKKRKNIRKRKTIRKRKQKGGNNLKVLYLINTDKGLPEAYNSIKDKSIVLSFKEETPDTKIFLPNSTWTDARNKLREYAINLPEKYDYYVFLDNDIKFKDLSHEEGFKKFEEYLNTYKPDIGVPNYIFFEGYHCKKTLDNIECTKDTVINETMPVIQFDPLMNAFSREVFLSDKIFPYDNKYDSKSWWISGYILRIKLFYYYNNKVILFNNLLIENQGHSSYPQEWNPNLLKEVYDSIITTIPENLKKTYGLQTVF